MGGCKRKGDHMLTAKGDLYLIVVKHWKTSFEKNFFFCLGEYAEYGFDQQTPYPTGEKHTISTFVDQTYIQ